MIPYFLNCKVVCKVVKRLQDCITELHIKTVLYLDVEDKECVKNCYGDV